MPTSSEVERVVTLPSGIDLHARPAAQLVRTAVGFSAEIAVAVNGRKANAKSLIAVLALGATAGTPLRLTASGEDAAVAVDALGECVAAFDAAPRLKSGESPVNQRAGEDSNL